MGMKRSSVVTGLLLVLLLADLCLAQSVQEDELDEASGQIHVKNPLVLNASEKAEPREPKNFMVLRGDEFLNSTKGNMDSQGFLVFFGTEWCSHCKHFKPIFMETAEKVLERELGAKPLFVYHPVEKDTEHVGKMFRVRGYPTIFYVVKDHYWEFDGKREQGQILEWLDKVQAGKEGEGKEFPDRLPTFFEEIQDSFDEINHVIKHHYKYNTLIFCAIAACFALLMFLCVATIYQLCTEEGGQYITETTETNKQKRD
jgi:thiol-disulfide isomerase/thioredoxin